MAESKSFFLIDYNMYAINRDDFRGDITCASASTTNWLVGWSVLSMLFWLPGIFRIICNSPELQVNTDHGKLRGPVRKSENNEEQMKKRQWVKKQKLA